MNEQLKTYHNVHEWTQEDVKNWLIEKGFNDNICELFETHKIDGKALLTLREDDLKHSLQLNCLGEIKKLYLSISHLQTINITFYSKLSTNTFLDLNNINYLQLKEQLKIELLTETNQRRNHSSNINRKKLPYQRLKDDHETTSIESIPEDVSELDDDNDLVKLRKKFLANGKYQEFKPEAWKAVVAMIYFFVVTWITAIVMVIVHDRVPDMTKYPPLPDIFLDNVPLIPHSFKICELIGLILFILSILLLVFHKHRFILIRRMFSLFGSVFLLRCVTMLITSLSVPGRHLNCKARPYGDWQDKLKQAYLIWQGAGMSIQGVRTCGDYMFSGHTVTLTLLNFFITEYTPTSFYFVHTLSWVLNLFGIFFILAGHEHYSIDVFIAFYITTRLFLYYHTLANNRCLYSGDRKRTRIWFPLFYFFESSVNGIVPNEFEIPFRNLFKWTNRSSIIFNNLNFNSNTDQLINNIKNQSEEVIKTLKKEYPKINLFNGGIKSANSSELNNSITKLNNGNSIKSSKRNKKKKQI